MYFRQVFTHNVHVHVNVLALFPGIQKEHLVYTLVQMHLISQKSGKIGYFSNLLCNSDLKHLQIAFTSTIIIIMHGMPFGV